MNPNISHTQNPEAVKNKHIGQIKLYMSNGLEDMARAYDKKNNIGYFASLDEAGKPHYEKWLDRFITVHPEMLQLKADIKTLMHIEDSVLIQGETGTGKELIGHALHGTKTLESFVSINCAGLPEYLLESELFGHVKGAFTGADVNKAGLLKMANLGTVFLDEIGDMPFNLQAKLLRAIQERRIRKVGANSDEEITCRFVAATHHLLPALVKAGKFRKDLYERLSTFELHTLPIRSRLNDIPLIVESLDKSGKFPREFKWTRVDTIETYSALGNTKYIPTVDLSGNVRSIQKIVRRYLVLKKLPITT